MQRSTAFLPPKRPASTPDERQILGINFYVGDVEGVSSASRMVAFSWSLPLQH